MFNTQLTDDRYYGGTRAVNMCGLQDLVQVRDASPMHGWGRCEPRTRDVESASSTMQSIGDRRGSRRMQRKHDESCNATLGWPSKVRTDPSPSTDAAA